MKKLILATAIITVLGVFFAFALNRHQNELQSNVQSPSRNHQVANEKAAGLVNIAREAADPGSRLLIPVDQELDVLPLDKAPKMAPLFGELRVSSKHTIEDVLTSDASPQIVMSALQKVHGIYMELCHDMKEELPGITVQGVNRDNAVLISQSGAMLMEIRVEQNGKNEKLYVPCPPKYESQLAELQMIALDLTSRDGYRAMIEDEVLGGNTQGVRPEIIDRVYDLNGIGYEIVGVNGESIAKVSHRIPGMVQ